jgi:hypothetical protein
MLINYKHVFYSDRFARNEAAPPQGSSVAGGKAAPKQADIDAPPHYANGEP